MVASIDDLLRMKRAAGRTKDLLAVEILSALKEERDKLKPRPQSRHVIPIRHLVLMLAHETAEQDDQIP